MSAINRWLSASRRQAKEEERERLIRSQGNSPKEMPAEYSLSSINFDTETRVAKLEFLQSQYYRTIERYVTQNYVKYPIYSEWKIKTKTVKRSIKLTNAELERLDRDEDPLISRFAPDIVIALNSEELIPSWFVKAVLDAELNEKLSSLNNELSEFCIAANKKAEQCKDIMARNDRDIAAAKYILDKQKRKIAKLTQKIAKATAAKRSIFICIITFGIYGYYISARRLEKLKTKLFRINETLQGIERQIDDLKKDNEKQTAVIDESIKRQELKGEEIRASKAAERTEYENKLKEITPLECGMIPDQSFRPLRSVIGYEYKKIIGCYIIHNREKDKYYVGQSKDVMKRLRQHFKGTVPNNIIFAEDYYSSEFADKSELFEVKIIPCETKDELDRTEKELIARYDSWNNGYNGTSGNT